MDKRLERLIKKTIDDSTRYKNIKEILVTEEFKKLIGEDAKSKGQEKIPKYIMGIPITIDKSIKDDNGYKFKFRGDDKYEFYS